MNERIITVKAGDLWHGNQDIDSGAHYYPQLTAKVFDDTFRVLDTNPDAEDDELPLTQVWDDYLLSVFGYRPTSEHTADEGRGWRWERMRVRLRTTHNSLRKNGFDLRKCSTGELLKGRMSSEGKICVIQGNKRLSLVRTGEGLDFPIDLRMVPPLGDWEEFTVNQMWPPSKRRIYHPLGHPDLKAWEDKGAMQPCEERWKMMQPYLAPTGKLLDLGCHTGWFCRRFRDNGWTSIGVDNEAPVIRMANTMLNWSPQSNPNDVQFYHTDAGTYVQTNDVTADVCLCLSMLMHVSRDNPQGVTRFLQRVSQIAPIMFVDCSWGAYQKNLPFTESNIGGEIIKHTKYTEYHLLGQTKRENRPFYVFTR